MELTTLCYIEKDDCYLMLHRVSKKNDINKDKWIGVGGHVEGRESPDECLLREVREETGLELTSYRMRGIVTFLSGRGTDEYMFLFTADDFVPAGPAADTLEREGSPADKVHAAPGTTRHIAKEDIPLKQCDEGVLKWVKKSDVPGLNLWEGDRIFLKLLLERDDFFLLKLVYDENDCLTEAVLDGQTLF